LPLNGHSRKRLINLAVQAKCAACHCHPLGFLLGLVADRLISGNRIQYAGLRPSKAQMLDRLVVVSKSIFSRSRPLNGQKGSQCRLMGGQPGAYPP
jgi:hypothetical protein